MKTLLLLEDNEERVAAFRAALPGLGADWRVVHWWDAPTMMEECEDFLADCQLVSLNHDLTPRPGALRDPGTGLEVAALLASHPPVCPVVIHSSNVDRAWSMHNELRLAGWTVERLAPLGDDWIGRTWMSMARQLAMVPSSPPVVRPPDHAERLARVRLSLEGVALGDAIGEMLASRHHQAANLIAEGLAAGPWFHTDDTEMALSVAEVLRFHGRIHQEALTRRFAWRFARDPDRGYGSMTRRQLAAINRGEPWRRGAAEAFGGQGSMGNGGAMRAAPVGAYFADDPTRVAGEATASSLVTHTHPEGVAGTVAVAVAAAQAWRLRAQAPASAAKAWFEAVLDLTPESAVRRGVRIAAGTPGDLPGGNVAAMLGNGSRVTAQDTVPFALWVAAHHRDSFERSLAVAIEAGGDCDTVAAIVGGIVAPATGWEGIPVEWRQSKEPFNAGGGCRWEAPAGGN